MSGNEPSQTDQEFRSSPEGEECSSLSDEWARLNLRLGEYQRERMSLGSLEDKIKCDAEIDRLKARQAQIEREQARLYQAFDNRNSSAPPGGTLTTRERITLLKLIIGMATKGYGFDPAAKRSDTASTIASDLDEIGISVDADTVRKYLKEAAQLVPGKPSDRSA